MNTFQLAKANLAKEETKRAEMLVKLRNEQTELELLKTDMVGKDGESKAVAKYIACKNHVDAYMAVLEDMDRVRIPAAKAKVSHERTVIGTAAQVHCSKLRDTAVVALKEKFNEALLLMDAHRAAVQTYLKEQGSPPIPSRLGRIGISDIPRETGRLLGL